MVEEQWADDPGQAPDLFTDSSPGPAFSPQSPTLTLQEAQSRIGPKILQALEAKFNGSLTLVRAIDKKDQLF